MMTGTSNTLEITAFSAMALKLGTFLNSSTLQRRRWIAHSAIKPPPVTIWSTSVKFRKAWPTNLIPKSVSVTLATRQPRGQILKESVGINTIEENR